MYEPRFYRDDLTSEDLSSFVVRAGESDLLIRASKDLKKEAMDALLKSRDHVQFAITENPEFAKSLKPLPDDPHAAPIIRQMLQAASLAGTGPMAAVAGAIAEAVGRSLGKECPIVLVENGGDLFLHSDRELGISIIAGASPLSGRLALRFFPQDFPLGVATSSATVGHSLSQGAADAACVVSRDAALADACATALGNMISGPDDIEAALQKINTIPGVRGALVIIGDKFGAVGEISLERL